MNALREKQKRNLLATLFFSQGVPMLVAGDELGRTQRGNNNAYCQDNETSWLDWEGADRELMQFVIRLVELRKRHPSFRRRTYPKPEDTAWLAPEGREMVEQDWKLPFARCFGMLMVGQRLAERDEHGNADGGRRPAIAAERASRGDRVRRCREKDGRAVLDTADRPDRAREHLLVAGPVARAARQVRTRIKERPMPALGRWIGMVAALGALAAGGCGGGDDGSSPPVGVPQVTLTVQRVFPALSFAFPVAMLQAPNDATRWFVVEQGGVVRVFDNNPNVATTTTFIDISGLVTFPADSELGLLGMAFHPQFADQSGRVSFLLAQ